MWTGGILVVPFHGFLVGELELGKVGRSRRDVALWLPWVPAEADVGRGLGVCWCGPGRLERVPVPCSRLCYQEMGHEKCSLVSLTLKRVSAVPYPLGIYSRVSEWVFLHIVNMPFALLLFCCATWWVNLSTGSLVTFFPTASLCVLDGVPISAMAPCLLPVSVWSLFCLLRGSSWVSPELRYL